MKERPMLFSGPMVRALLDDSKTQTRRVMKTQLVYGLVANLFNSWYLPRGDSGGTLYPNGKEKILATCPYGQPGERIWVRETFVQGWDYDPVTDRIQQFDVDGKQLPMKTWYRADGADIGWCDADGWQANTPWKPSIHMPRSASRINLEITQVRIERLQSISESDAMAEGIVRQPDGGYGLADTTHYHATDPRQSYFSLWEAINGDGSVEANPWVWCVTFRRLP